MGLKEGLGDHFGKPHCEQLIKYDTRHIEFSSLGAEYAGAKFSLGDFKTDVGKVEESSELAKSLDAYQYNVCQKTRGLPKDLQTQYIECQIAAIGLLSALRFTLEAFKEDPEGEKQRLENIVDKMQDFMIAMAEETTQKAKASDHAFHLTVWEPKLELAKSKAFTEALALSGLTSKETNDLAKEFANKLQQERSD